MRKGVLVQSTDGVIGYPLLKVCCKVVALSLGRQFE